MELLTAQELAGKLRLTVDTVWRYTRAGRIPCLKLGPRDYRYDLSAVLNALADGEEPGKGRTEGGDSAVELKPADPGRLRAFANEPPPGSP